MAASRPARSGRHGSNLVCALPSPKSGRPVRTESHRPARRVPDPAGVRPPDPTRQADQEARLSDSERTLDEIFIRFLRSEVGTYKAPLRTVVKTLKRDAPGVLSALSFGTWSDMIHASIDRAVKQFKADTKPRA